MDILKLGNKLKQLHSVMDLGQDNDEKMSDEEIDELMNVLPVTDDGYLNIKWFLDSIM